MHNLDLLSWSCVVEENPSDRRCKDVVLTGWRVPESMAWVYAEIDMPGSKYRSRVDMGRKLAHRLNSCRRLLAALESLIPIAKAWSCNGIQDDDTVSAIRDAEAAIKDWVASSSR